MVIVFHESLLLYISGQPAGSRRSVRREAETRTHGRIRGLVIEKLRSLAGAGDVTRRTQDRLKGRKKTVGVKDDLSA